MVAIENNIAAYDAVREELERCHTGKWSHSSRIVRTQEYLSVGLKNISRS
jgi:hypothetical protein